MPNLHYLLAKSPLPAFMFLCLFFVSPFFSNAQLKTISGIVTDESGNALSGVTVMVQKTKVATVTNEKGRYTIAAENGATLVFSATNVENAEVVVGDQPEYNLTLKLKVTALTDVVVVAYGKQKKVNLVGSVGTVNMDEKMTGRPIPNISTGLSGLVPGLAVTQNTGMVGRDGAELLIRGRGTSNNSNPLIVVDGMPDVDINRIDVNDIETISVLKDATSSSVYGSRAANGVILITTKSGKGMRKTSMNFTSNMAIVVPTKGFEFMADYPRSLTLEQRRAATNTLPANQLFKKGTIDQWMALGMIDPLRYPNTDWWDIIMRNGTFQNYSLSASGGNDKSNFFISAGMKTQEGLQINNDFNQYNARFNFDYKIRNNMNTGVKFNGNWSKFIYALEEGFTDPAPTNTAGFDMQYAIAGITPFDPATGYFGGVMAYGEDPQAYNPYMVYVNTPTRQNRQEANASMYWDWSPVKGLTAAIDYGLNYYNQFSYNANMPAQAYNFQTNSFGSRVYVGPNAPIVNNTNTGYKTLLNARLNYHTIFKKNHDISALFVYSEEYWYDRFQGSSRNDRLFPTLHEIDAALTDIQGTGGNSSTEGLQSYIGRVNYTAFNKYLFEGNFRVDGSSKFVPGQQYGFFPSAAVGWRFTEEDFLRPFLEKFLTSGKLRVSYGSLGNNSGIGRYEQRATLAANNYIIANSVTRGFVNTKLINKVLSWEATNILDIGLELGFLRGRLTAEIDYYDRVTTGLVRPSDLSILLSGAFTAPRTNIGQIRNRGVEGNFTWRDRIGKISYGLSANVAYNRNLLEGWNEFIARGATSGGANIFLNMPWNFVYAYQSIGIAQTWADVYNATPQGAQPGDILRQDLNGDGRIDGNDQKAYPTIQRDRPTTYFGFNGYASWKGIDIALYLNGAAGRKDFWLNAFNNLNFSTARYATTWDHWNNPWSVENRNGAWPRLGGSGNNTITGTFWLDDMSYLRVKNLQVGYTIPKKLFGKTGINSLRIAGSAENLWTISSYRGLDPEKAGNNNNLYPISKTYSLVFQLGF